MADTKPMNTLDLDSARVSVIGKSMLQTGTDCTAIPGKAKSSRINSNQNAAGRFRTVTSIKDVSKWAYEEADAIKKNFPPK